MTLGEIHELTGRLLADGVSPDANMKVASQPSYPLTNRILGVVSSDELDEAYDAAGKSGESDPNTVWIVTDQDADDPYAPRTLWSAL